MSRVPLYDALAADYDRFVNWEGRLDHELPFLLRLFKNQGVHSLLDAACGTGQHAIALARRGYQVLGADLSAAMIAQAADNAAAAGTGNDAAFVQAPLGELAALGQTFDAALCLGNSLPHLLTARAVELALADLAALLRPGGLLVIQTRNFDRVWAGQERFMAPQSHRSGSDEWLFVRFYDFHDRTLTFNMIRLRRTADGWAQDVESTELRPILSDDLAAALAAAGLEQIALYGGYDGAAFDPERSSDLVAVARRAA